MELVSLLKSKEYFYLSILPIISLGFFVYLAWSRTSHALVHAFDTGLYLQLINNIWSHHDFASSMTGEQNFLAHHFQPIMIFLSPIAMFNLSPMMLYFVSMVCIVSTVIVFFKFSPINRFAKKDASYLVYFTFLMTLIWHPTVANRMYFSFVPEVIALPFLMVQACLLFKIQLKKNDLILLVICQLVAGLCKENIWLVNFVVCLTFAYIQKPKQKFFYSLAAANILIFCFLFFYWMPKNTSLPSYYALRYFANPSVEITGKITLLQAMIYNVFSLQSLKTLFLIILSTGVLSVAMPTRAVFPGLVGIGFVLISSHSLVHILGNHYMLLSLPFLWVGAVYNLQKPRFSHPMITRWVCVCLILAPMYMTLGGNFGVYIDLNKVKKYPYTSLILDDLDKIRKELKPNSKILADANLSTYLPEYRNLKNILNFVGNPYDISSQDMAEATDVITSVELRNFPGRCGGVKEIKALDKLDYNYDSFYRFCDWLVNNKMVLKPYPDSKLYHYRYLN